MPPGIPQTFFVPYYIQIVQAPKHVVVAHEYLNLFRIIPTDGRPHPPDPDPSWMGNPVGRWEGDTLVVDSIGFNDKTEINGYRHTESLHVVERFRRPDFDTLQYEATIEDPNVFAGPWVIRRTFPLLPEYDSINEFVCENNRDYKPLFGNKMRLAYHGTPKKYFESLDPGRPYVPEPFAREGFIHTTEGREAVSITLTKYYKASAEPWVVLYIDQDRVTSPIRYDDPAEVFPHIYGPLNRDAIVAVKDIDRAPDGTFLKPRRTSAYDGHDLAAANCCRSASLALLPQVRRGRARAAAGPRSSDLVAGNRILAHGRHRRRLRPHQRPASRATTIDSCCRDRSRPSR